MSAMAYIVAVIVGVIIVLWSLPIIVFLSAKLGAFGYLRGKQLFQQTLGEKKDEEDQTTT